MADADVFTISTHELAEVRTNLAQAALTLTGDHQLRAMRLRDFFESFDPKVIEKLKTDLEEMTKARDGMQDDVRGIEERAANMEDALGEYAKGAWAENFADAVGDFVQELRNAGALPQSTGKGDDVDERADALVKRLAEFAVSKVTDITNEIAKPLWEDVQNDLKTLARDGELTLAPQHKAKPPKKGKKR